MPATPPTISGAARVGETIVAASGAYTGHDLEFTTLEFSEDGETGWSAESALQELLLAPEHVGLYFRAKDSWDSGAEMAESDPIGPVTQDGYYPDGRKGWMFARSAPGEPRRYQYLDGTQ